MTRQTFQRSWLVGVALTAALGLGCAALFTGSAAAQQGDVISQPPAAAAQAGNAQSLEVHDISLEQAMAVIAAARQHAGEIDTKMDIAVVDRGGNLKAFVRMDDAWLGSIDIALKKAKTARYFDMPTGDIGGLSQPGGPLYQIEVSNEGLITFPGGLPLRNAQGEVIGAVGVSGSSVENDHAVAEAGAAAVQ